MFSKVYEKIKEFIRENYLILSFYFVLVAICFYPLPYYIYTGGGLIDVEDRIEIENAYSSEGSFHLCYVSELRATLPYLLLTKVFPSWDVVKMDEVALSTEETDEDIFLRDRLFLNTGNTNAIKTAYEKAGKLFEVTDTKNYVIYVSDRASSDLKIGDDIRAINGQTIENLSDIREIVSKVPVGEKVEFTILREKKEESAYAYVYEEQGNSLIGVMIQSDLEYQTDPEIELYFAKSEAGSSGGLLLTLSIYNQLVEEDITNGSKIAGTGTMERDGSVGSIGGVKYKLAGAVKEKADVFLVPKGENYEEAIEEKEKNHYSIQIIGVESFEDALEQLEKLKS